MYDFRLVHNVLLSATDQSYKHNFYHHYAALYLWFWLLIKVFDLSAFIKRTKQTAISMAPTGISLTRMVLIRPYPLLATYQRSETDGCRGVSLSSSLGIMAHSLPKAVLWHGIDRSLKKVLARTCQMAPERECICLSMLSRSYRRFSLSGAFMARSGSNTARERGQNTPCNMYLEPAEPWNLLQCYATV